MVLDELSSNLDISSIKDLTEVIRQWQSENKTVIVAEHRLYYLAPYADRIIYMKRGEICNEYTREEFLELIYKCCTHLMFIEHGRILWHRPMDNETVKCLQEFFSHEKGDSAMAI